MKNIQLKNVVLDAGKPKIAVSLAGKNIEEIMEECNKISELSFDIIEWRADYYLSKYKNIGKELEKKEFYLEILKTLDYIDYSFSDKPIIFTLRSKNQGGQIEINSEDRNGIYDLIINSNMVEAIDIEVINYPTTQDIKADIKYIKDAGIKVITSYHKLSGMLVDGEAIKIAEKMNELGSDILKICAKAETKEDAKFFLKELIMINNRDIGPMIMLALGENGRVTRVAGGKYGSSITFAYVGTPTAEGQMDVKSLHDWIEEYYGEK